MSSRAVCPTESIPGHPGLIRRLCTHHQWLLFPCEVLIYTSLRQLSMATPQSRQTASWCRWVRKLAQRSYTISTSFQMVPLLWVKVWELTQEDQDLAQMNAILFLVWCLSLVTLPGQPCDVLEASTPCLLAFF